MKCVKKAMAAEHSCYPQSPVPFMGTGRGRKRGKSIFLAAGLLLLLLTACGREAVSREISSTQGAEAPLVTDTDSLEILSIGQTDPLATTPLRDASEENWKLYGGANEHDTLLSEWYVAEGGITKEYRQLHYGTLSYCFSNARLICRADELPEKELDSSKFRNLGDVVFQQGDSYETIKISDPEFLQADGSFYPGAYIVLVDVTVTSNGAVNWTTNDTWDDLGSQAIPGEFADPYIFRADVVAVGELDMDKAKSSPEEPCFDPHMVEYYSRLGEQSENEMAFRLEPGESTSYIVGFLVSDEDLGGLQDISRLALSDAGIGYGNGTYVSLGLSVQKEG